MTTGVATTPKMTSQSSQSANDEPVCDWPLAQALEELFGWEVLVIEKRFGKDIGNLPSVSLTMAVVWAMENRRRKADRAPLFSWPDVESWSLRQMNAYFPKPPDEDDPDEPETELGKG